MRVRQASDSPCGARCAAPQPGPQTIAEDQVSECADEIAGQPLAVPPEPVRLAPAAPPAVPLPGLERIAHHPAGALLERLAEPLRKELARCHRLAGNELDGDEQLPAADLVQPQTDLIVFRETAGVENAILPPAGGFFERAARVSGAHSVRGQEPAQDQPRRHVLGLVFGELVAVHAVREAVERRAERQHRDLDHLVAIHGVAEAA